jgi:hypothetical protein
VTSRATGGQRKDSHETIGLLGGMSWESSIVYERVINEEVGGGSAGCTPPAC